MTRDPKAPKAIGAPHGRQETISGNTLIKNIEI